MGKHWTRKDFRLAALLAAAASLLAAGVLATVSAAPVADIRSTPHNLSRTGLPNSLNNVRAPDGGETAVCAFCHTPHQANTQLFGPLWNRNNVTQTYTRYTSSSMDANYILEGFTSQPAGSSMLCLSCHDGMVALGSVNVLNGQSQQTITLNNTENGKMPSGPQGALSGFTRLIGTDLTNDHPISVTYNDTLTAMDGELTRMTSNVVGSRDAITGNLIGVRVPGYKPLLPLFPTGVGRTGQVQCPTCHDPHITAEKFLRLSRFQVGGPTGGNFNENNDQICLACHPKLGQTWAESAHANPVVADEAYLDDAATRRQFAKGTKVWQAACLNCHDTHTVQGARRLLREGVESGFGGSGAGSYRLGSPITPADTTSSIENTCYQCHDNTGSLTRVIGTTASSTVPDIKTEFQRYVRMPISTTEQLRNKREVHDIVDSNFTESPELLGKNNPENRHVECTDCHNPHRVRRASTFYGTSATTGEGAKRTHNAGGTAAMKGADGNVASGVLRGQWGVEPVFGPTSSTWPQLPMQYIVKKGDPGLNTSTERTKTYLTREYQLCFKCHSNYSNSDDMRNFPPLGNTLGGTTGSNAQRNYLTRYTNVAAEFGSVRATDPPSSGTDQGEIGNDTRFTPNGSAPSAGDNNHRSWHPVMWPTGRTSKERSGTDTGFTNIRAPFNTAANVGFQTMHCSDCHGNPTSWTQNTGPNLSVTQGPHGSDKKFLLKGDWNLGTGGGQSPSSPGLCGNCHNPTGGMGGFKSGEASHGGQYKDGAPCNFCHIALPHGWKNKAFLVNLNCVGTEAGLTPGCTKVSNNYTVPPYYVNARLVVTQWQSSTNWNNCSNCFGGENGMESNCGEW
ncbi:hypothetical protein EGT07_02290 [Herbaspirillum sp. HC18]|nr:hypothetical protein EGT07_02290 [Herbaspirillum sp. HC18]